MVPAYYVSMCALSLVCCTIYFFIKRSYFPFRYATVFILAFLSQFCYVLLALSKDVREALIKRVAIQNTQSGERYMLADHDKFGQSSAVTFSDFGGTVVITDKNPGDLYMKSLDIKVAEEW